MRGIAVAVPLVAVLVAAYLLFTDPSDVSYDCPGTTWTLLTEPAPPGPGSPEDFFDAGTACNSAAADRARTTLVIVLSALSLLAVLAAVEVAVTRRYKL